jgi:Arc/MetJ family transcription regulator
MDRMKKTMMIDDALLAEARAACGADTDTATVHEGLRALVTRAAHEELRALLGTERGPVVDVPRRREPPVKRRKRRAA